MFAAEAAILGLVVKEELVEEDVAVRRDAILLKRIGNRESETTAIEDDEEEDWTATAVFPDCDADDDVANVEGCADSDEIDTRMVGYDDGVANAEVPLPSAAPQHRAAPSSSVTETPTPTPSKAPSPYTAAKKSPPPSAVSGSPLVPKGAYFERRDNSGGAESGALLYVNGALAVGLSG